MKCSSCGRKIKGEPIWIDGEPYCSQECTDMGPDESKEIEDEEEDEEKW